MKRCGKLVRSPPTGSGFFSHSPTLLDTRITGEYHSGGTMPGLSYPKIGIYIIHLSKI